MIYDDMIYDTCTWARVTHTYGGGGGGGGRIHQNA